MSKRSGKVHSVQSKHSELCTCGSGDLYKDCHGPILSAPPKKQLSVAQARYALGWEANANGYQDQGVYEHLAAELAALGDVRRIFDIGCGLGHGLDALRNAIPISGSMILGVDENPDCVLRAVERLGLEMIPAAHKRLQHKRQISGRFKTHIRNGGIPAPGPISVINADMLLEDPTLNNWLAKLAPFDAVTMWFMGVHKGRSMTTINDELGIVSDRDNRERLEQKQIELAASLLRPGGVLQLVNRVVSTEINSYRVTLADQATEKLANSPFHLVSLNAYPYTELGVTGSIRVSQPGFEVDGLPRYATSALAKKQ